MIKFVDNDVYASCHNEGGFFALPVGEVYLVDNDGTYRNVAFSDYVDGNLLNSILKHNPRDFKKIIFKHPDGREQLIYEKD